MPDDLVDYLRGQRDAYTPAALTQRAIDAGYSAWQVEAAWAIVDPSIARRRSPGRAILEVIGGLCVIGVALLYGGAILLSLFGMLYGNSPIVLVLYVAGLLIVGAVVIAVLRRAPSGPFGDLTFVAVVAVAIAAFYGLSGACQAALVAR